MMMMLYMPYIYIYIHITMIKHGMFRTVGLLGVPTFETI